MIRLLRLCALVAALAPLAAAAANGPGPVNDPGLVAAAKREGALSIYGAMNPQQLATIAGRFEATYGVKVDALRLESEKLPARVMTEVRAGRHEIDLVIEPGFPMQILKQQGILTAIDVPERKELLAGAFDPEGYWYSVYLDLESISYNTVKLKEAGLKPPVSWEDLAAPAWRGKFSLFASGYEWYAALKKFYGRERADNLLRSYAANQPRMLSGHTLGVTMVVSGEVIASANTYSYAAAIEKDKGSPIEIVNPTPTVIETLGVAALKAAPHPNAARLFVRWWLSREMQQFTRASLGRVVARKDVKNDPRLMDPKVRYVFSNPADFVNANDDIHSFNQLFNIPG